MCQSLQFNISYHSAAKCKCARLCDKQCTLIHQHRIRQSHQVAIPPIAYRPLLPVRKLNPRLGIRGDNSSQNQVNLAESVYHSPIISPCSLDSTIANFICSRRSCRTNLGLEAEKKKQSSLAWRFLKTREISKETLISPLAFPPLAEGFQG